MMLPAPVGRRPSRASRPFASEELQWYIGIGDMQEELVKNYIYIYIYKYIYIMVEVKFLSVR